VQIEEQKPPQKLARGQIWKLDDGYVYIVEPGRRLVHYKMLKNQRQKAVMTRMVGVEKLEALLKEHAAELVNGVSAN
jgi:hypothetical protein